jgi:hypothetical protein
MSEDVRKGIKSKERNETYNGTVSINQGQNKSICFKTHSSGIQRLLEFTSFCLPHSARSKLILIIFRLVMKLLRQFGVFVEDFLKMVVPCQFVYSKQMKPLQFFIPELMHRADYRICEIRPAGLASDSRTTGDQIARWLAQPP